MNHQKFLIHTGLLGIMIAGLGGCISKTGYSSCSAIDRTIQASSQRSLGDKILITNVNFVRTEELITSLQEFTTSFKRCDVEQAAKTLKVVSDERINDPEAWIYYNNAQVLKGNKQPVKIVVSVPISGNEEVSQEILRGVALAQYETNNSLKNQQDVTHQPRPLLIEIADDENNPETAKKLANEFVKDISIWGVIGHYSSSTSLKAAPVYHQGGLVMISPTSTTTNLPVISPYIFRTIISDYQSAKLLSNYLAQQSIHKIAFCIDSKDAYGQSLKGLFNTFMKDPIIEIGCDLQSEANLNFNPDIIVSEAIKQRVQGIFIVPSVDSVDQPIQIAQANSKQGGNLYLFGGDSMYQLDTLEKGGSDVENMILAIPWHRDSLNPENNQFQNSNRQLFGSGQISWRTAMAYNATKVMIEGLKTATTRQQLQEVLNDQSFSVKGATADIQFNEFGEPKGKPQLVIIKARKNQPKTYEFKSLSFSEDE